MNHIDMDSLTELLEWRRAFDPPLDVDGILATKVRVAGAAAVADLMCPALLEGDVHAVEAVMNHVHLWDVFRPGDDAERRALDALAQRFAVCWRAAAQDQFPGREITVEVSDDFGPTLTLVSS